MKVVVIGRTGQVARALAARAFAGASVTHLGRPEFDLQRLEGVVERFSEHAPDVVINAAAYTAVDSAEDDKDLAFAVNATAVGILAQAARSVGAGFIQLSTDYVFDGEKHAPYVETDPVNPRTVYGASKAQGERLALEAGAVVLRTAWVFDAQGKNFVRTMLRLARAQPTVSVVADQHGSPTFADDLADAILSVARDMEGKSGIHHCAGSGETTWAAFAGEIFRISRAIGGPSASMIPIESGAFPTRVQRPHNSRLDCSKLNRDFGVTLPHWADALERCMGEIALRGWPVG